MMTTTFGEVLYIVRNKSILYINVKKSSIEIYGNSFTKCNSLGGSIIITRESSYNGGILIHNNEFTQNSALFYVNVLRLILQRHLIKN